LSALDMEHTFVVQVGVELRRIFMIVK
jgi:hypothetical protein